MKISILHASRSRPQMAHNTRHKWLSSALYPQNIEYILSLDDDDPLISKYDTPFICNDTNRSAIDAFNRAAEQSMGQLLIAISDDFDCPLHWDKLLIDAIGDRTDFCAKTDDGQQSWIITLPIMDRVYYERFGYIYHPEYNHLFCDTEMTHVADMLGRKVTLPITFPHNHYTTGVNAKDAVNVKNDATWAQGEALYLERMKRNFYLPVSSIVKDFKLPKDHYMWLRSKGAI